MDSSSELVNEQWLSIKEVGAIVGLSRDTVKRRIDEGMLKAWVDAG